MDLAARIGELRNLSPEQLAERAGALLPPWISLLLVIVVAWKLAGLTWTLLPAGELPAAVSPGGSANRSAPGDVQIFSIGDIVNAHLFGIVTAETQAPAGPVPEDLPEVTDLALSGIIAGHEPDQGLAIISANRNNEKVYAVGDTIEGVGYRVHQVYPDRVIVERGGALQQLRLPRADEGTNARATTARNTPVRPAPVAPAGNNRPSLSLRQAIGQDPGRLTDIVRPQPVFANGQQRGYRVYPGRNRQQFAQLGLQAGDLVTEINGLALTDPQSGMEIFRSLGEAGAQVSVTVERNGQPEIVVLDTSTLASTLEATDEDSADKGDSGQSGEEITE